MADNQLQHSQQDAAIYNNTLFEQISALINESRRSVATAINLAEVYTKFQIGKYIVEYEQQGEKRAGYGKRILIGLSEQLTERFGEGWAVEKLRLIRQFYLVYSENPIHCVGNSENPTHRIGNAELEQLPYQKNADGSLQVRNLPASIDTRTMPKFILSWSHYVVLMRIKDPEERHFYELEAAQEMWSVRQLQRQYASSLYERLLLSKDKNEVMRLSREGHQVGKMEDVLKNPISLEFLGIKPNHTFSETKLETKIIDHLQEFLLELGKGFLFEARQKRFTFDEDYFYVDLVCYNRLLQCYVLIDLKVDKLTHQDLGQMQMYVNYFDRYVRAPFEKPTIGILLCKNKNDALVELTLPPDANIYAAEYALYLPDKKELQQKLQEWTEEAE